MEEFGYPPQFPGEDDKETESVKTGKKIKSKVAAKTGNTSYQWQIMESLGLKDEEIKKFSDPHYWLKYFPPIAMSDLKDLGCKASNDGKVLSTV